jgi:phage baseplate assembly protein W
VISALARGATLNVRETVEDNMRRFEYRVLELRENRIGGALSGDKLEEILNDEAREGWMLKSITHADVKGRVGPGAVEGLILTFERPVA